MRFIASGFFIFCSLINFAQAQEVITNKHLNLSEIKTVFIEVDPDVKLEVFDKQNYINSWKSNYESLLLKAGFNVIARDKIESILKEQKLKMAGLTRNEIIYKAGEIAGADAIL